MRRIIISFGLPLLLLGGCGGRDQERSGTPVRLTLPAGAEAASQTILASELLATVKLIASDEMEGRLPGSRGDRRARQLLAASLAELGYEPGFPGGVWEQPLEIIGLTSHLPPTLRFHRGESREVAVRLFDDYMGVAGLQLPEVAVSEAEVVFVGYGIQAPEEQWDDFKGADLRGKILLMLNDDPDWDDNLFAGKRKLSYGRWTYKYESAARQGAAAALIIHTTASAGYPWQVVLSSSRGEQFELKASDEPRLEIKGWLTWDAASQVAALGGHQLEELLEAARSREFAPIPLGVTTSLSAQVDLRETETANVAGVLRGSDPELADELVVYSAHHDHFGIGEPDQTGDDIYNGALDNGVAMAQALAVAMAFTDLPQPPRRSIMVLFAAAEEQGLLGSTYFMSSGVVSPARIAANINFELGNVWGRTRDVTVFGYGKSELEELLAEAAARQDRVITPEYDVRAGWYYRSDQISFARAGVPAIWFKSGIDFIGHPAGWGEEQYAAWIEQRYHQPSDEVQEEWQLDGLVEDAQLAFLLGASVATATELPCWYPGDEFEDERLEMLAQRAR